MTIAFKAIRSPGALIDSSATQAALKKNMRKYADFLIHQLRQDYVDIPEGPNYKRKFHPPTGTEGVGGHWRQSVDADGNGVTVYNDVPYAKYVQGHLGEQSSYNVELGWNSIDTVALATRTYFNAQMGDAIREGIAKARRSRNRSGQFV